MIKDAEMDENHPVHDPKQDDPQQDDRPWGMDLNTFCLLMHLSQLLGFVIPFAGTIMPIVMWATNKDKNPDINLHGFIIFNWMLSSLIYAIVCFVLFFIVIGIPMMFVLGIVSLVFIIIGGVKANDGQYWPYPLSIDFFGVKAKLRED
ncbi:MAG: putative Tic20 family protein [Flavobacteriales bacterium]|jgi:uncharacterized Tic20 family protein